MLWLEGLGHRQGHARAPPASVTALTPHCTSLPRTPRREAGQGRDHHPSCAGRRRCGDLPVITQEPQWGSRRRGHVHAISQACHPKAYMLMCQHSRRPCSVLPTPSRGRGEPDHLDPSHQGKPGQVGFCRALLGSGKSGGAQPRPRHLLPRTRRPGTQQPLTKAQGCRPVLVRCGSSQGSADPGAV